MAKKEEQTFYRVDYKDPKTGQSVSIKAKNIADSSLGLSFIAISDFIFESGGLVVNPDEEAKKVEFQNIKTLHLSIYSVLSISEIGEHKASLKFKNDKSNLVVLNQETPGTPVN